MGAQRLSDVHQPAAAGIPGEIRVGQPEDVVGAAARDIGAQGVEVGRIGDDVDPHLDVGVLAGELVERLAVRRGDLLVPQSHRDHGPAGGFGGATQQHSGDEQHGHHGRQTRGNQRGTPWPQTHLSPVTTIDRTMCLPNTANNTISGTIATVVAAITSVHWAL